MLSVEEVLTRPGVSYQEWGVYYHYVDGWEVRVTERKASLHQVDYIPVYTSSRLSSDLNFYSEVALGGVRFTKVDGAIHANGRKAKLVQPCAWIRCSECGGCRKAGDNTCVCPWKVKTGGEVKEMGTGKYMLRDQDWKDRTARVILSMADFVEWVRESPRTQFDMDDEVEAAILTSHADANGLASRTLLPRNVPTLFIGPGGTLPLLKVCDARKLQVSICDDLAIMVGLPEKNVSSADYVTKRRLVGEDRRYQMIDGQLLEDGIPVFPRVGR